jgi:hypothetical protein
LDHAAIVTDRWVIIDLGSAAVEDSSAWKCSGSRQAGPITLCADASVLRFDRHSAERNHFKVALAIATMPVLIAAGSPGQASGSVDSRNSPCRQRPNSPGLGPGFSLTQGNGREKGSFMGSEPLAALAFTTPMPEESQSVLRADRQLGNQLPGASDSARPAGVPVSGKRCVRKGGCPHRACRGPRGNRG